MINITGSRGAAEAEILTPQALEFLAALSANLEVERERLLARPRDPRRSVAQGATLRFPSGNCFCSSE
jgi:hypothetical protein